jgi:uncharacterized protein (DUF1697 family)
MLLRAINVGRRQLPMAALREMAASFGYHDQKTHRASGNLVVTGCLRTGLHARS